MNSASFKIPNDFANLRKILNDAAIIAITDVQGKIIFSNDKFCRISKYSRAELIGEDHRIINSGYHSKEFFRALWRTIAQGKVWRGEIRNRAKDGTYYWVDTTIIPIVNEQGKPYQYMAIRYDITSRKELEEEIQSIPQRILQAQENERLRISKEIHDDLGQLLVALKIYLANSAYDLTVKYPELKSLTEDLKTRVNIIVDKTRDLSHELSPLSLEHISLEGALKELTDSMRLDKQIAFRFTHRNLKGVDLGERKIMIYRIVQGALMNVLKHSQAKTVEVSIVRKRKQLILRIKDDGKGFDVNEALKPGRGLGLALMRERAQMIGGDIAIESAARKGAEITVAVPIEEDKNARK